MFKKYVTRLASSVGQKKKLRVEEGSNLRHFALRHTINFKRELRFYFFSLRPIQSK